MLLPTRAGKAGSQLVGKALCKVVGEPHVALQQLALVRLDPRLLVEAQQHRHRLSVAFECLHIGLPGDDADHLFAPRHRRRQLLRKVLGAGVARTAPEGHGPRHRKLGRADFAGQHESERRFFLARDGERAAVLGALPEHLGGNELESEVLVARDPVPRRRAPLKNVLPEALRALRRRPSGHSA